MNDNMLTAESDSTAAAPAWTVTFGDLMALILTFFVLLASLGENVSDEKVQSVMRSMRRQFGQQRAKTLTNLSKARDERLAWRFEQYRRLRRDLFQREPVNEVSPQPRIAQVVHQAAASDGASVAITFESESMELDDRAKRQLGRLAGEWGEIDDRIEIRAYASPNSNDGESSESEPRDDTESEQQAAAFLRAVATRNFLVEGLGIASHRIRMQIEDEKISERASQQHLPRVDVCLHRGVAAAGVRPTSGPLPGSRSNRSDGQSQLTGEASNVRPQKR